jgi:hypothetical protein
LFNPDQSFRTSALEHWHTMVLHQLTGSHERLPLAAIKSTGGIR